jgi:hypothetical protein
MQGTLRNIGNQPAPDGKYTMEVALYSEADSVKAVYEEVIAAVEVSGVVFTVVLGGKGQLSSDVLTIDGAQWIGVAVMGEPELARLRLRPVPSAVSSMRLSCSGCIGNGHLDPSVLAPYAEISLLHVVATSGQYGDLEGIPAPADLSPFAKSPELHAVATSGQYGDLEGIPAPADLSPFAKSSELHAVATSGQYGDLEGIPAPAQVPTGRMRTAGMVPIPMVRLRPIPAAVGPRRGLKEWSPNGMLRPC